MPSIPLKNGLNKVIKTPFLKFKNFLNTLFLIKDSVLIVRAILNLLL